MLAFTLPFCCVIRPRLSHVVVLLLILTAFPFAGKCQNNGPWELVDSLSSQNLFIVPGTNQIYLDRGDFPMQRPYRSDDGGQNWVPITRPPFGLVAYRAMIISARSHALIFAGIGVHDTVLAVLLTVV